MDISLPAARSVFLPQLPDQLDEFKNAVEIALARSWDNADAIRTSLNSVVTTGVIVMTVGVATTGGILYFAGTTGWAIAASGGDGNIQVYNSSAGKPVWYDASGPLAANPASAGSLIISTAGDWAVYPPTTPGYVLMLNASTLPAWAILPVGKQFFTSSGTFTAPAGVTTVFLTAIAGGGGGGGTVTGMGQDGRGGGGAGQAIIKYPYAVTPTNSYTITINSGGAGSIGNGDGAVGGSVIFDTITLAGGKGNSPLTVGGLSGGTTNDGAINVAGDIGIKTGNGGSGSGTSFSGAGGSSPFGKGGAGRTNSGNGNDGTGYGTGGGGAIQSAGNSNNGGNGTNGAVLVEW